MENLNLMKYKEILLKKKAQILNGGLFQSKEDLTVQTEDLADETDLAASVINQQVTFNIRQKELYTLRLIEQALQRIEDGTYGHCEECEEFIGSKRLENQPWAEMCITHAEEMERQTNKLGRLG